MELKQELYPPTELEIHGQGPSSLLRPEEKTEAGDSKTRLSEKPQVAKPKRGLVAPPPAIRDQRPGMKLDTAIACMLVLTLGAVGLPQTEAVPISVPLRDIPEARGCHIAQFKYLSPQELQAFKKAKDAFEESLLLKDWSCNSHLFPRTWGLMELQVWERPVALEAELALTLKVLEALADSALGDVLDQPLHTLRHIHSELLACIPAQPTAGPRPRGRLRHWLHRLREAPRKESQSCLEASVTFNLFRLLTRDLKCVASRDLCV